MKSKDNNNVLEKVYVTRDEDSDVVFIWRKPKEGVWKPVPLKDCDIVNYQRIDRSLDNVDIYTYPDFKNKFNLLINKKSIKNVRISKNLLDNDDYKLFSDNPDRKR